MRKITEKVAIVALVCIALVFVVTTVLYMAGVIAPQENWAANGVSGPLVIVLAVLFAGLSAYLIYENFSTHANVKRVLLYCDSESATSADRRVVTNIVNGCAKQVEGIKVKKTRIAADDKQGCADVERSQRKRNRAKEPRHPTLHAGRKLPQHAGTEI